MMYLLFVLEKSTYARCGIIVNVTPLEPGWEGFVTLEFSNTTLYQRRYMRMRGCSIYLLKGNEKPEVTYAE